MSGSLLGSVAATAFALVLVLGLAFVAIRLLRVWQDKTMAARPGDDSGALRFLRAMPVGPRERVVLMEAEDERLLIGVASGSVTVLARWPRRPPAGQLLP